jgi:hypothetical protein
MSQSTLQLTPGGSPLRRRLLPQVQIILRALKGWLHALDQILRGETTHPSLLRETSLRIPLFGMSLLIVAMALSYGFCMGMFPGCSMNDPSPMRWLACTVKIPALFLLTLCVTFPSLYVVNALVGSRLQLPDVLQLLVAALAVNLAVLASAGPIVAFFSFSTTSSPFMVLLNVLVFAISGMLGMAFLLQTLHRMSTIPKLPRPAERRLAVPTTEPSNSANFSERWTSGSGHFLREGHELAADDSGKPNPSPLPAVPSEASLGSMGAAVPELEAEACALDRLQGHVLGRHVKTVFCCWTVIFGVVGAQMAWVLRPYFGGPNQPFVWFGPRTSNFFEGVLSALQQLLRS